MWKLPTLALHLVAALSIGCDSGRPVEPAPSVEPIQANGEPIGLIKQLRTAERVIHVELLPLEDRLALQDEGGAAEYRFPRTPAGHPYRPESVRVVAPAEVEEFAAFLAALPTDEKVFVTSLGFMEAILVESEDSLVEVASLAPGAPLRITIQSTQEKLIYTETLPRLLGGR